MATSPVRRGKSRTEPVDVGELFGGELPGSRRNVLLDLHRLLARQTIPLAQEQGGLTDRAAEELLRIVRQ